MKIPASKVLWLLSNTTKDKAKLIAVPPIALITVPKVMIVKFFVHKVAFLSIYPFFLSAYSLLAGNGIRYLVYLKIAGCIPLFPYLHHSIKINMKKEGCFEKIITQNALLT